MSNKPADCMDDFDPDSLGLDEAIERILEQVTSPGGTESISIENAFGRVVSEAIQAQINVPPFTSSAMDGYAINSADIDAKVEVFTLAGASLAGHPFNEKLKPGCCVRVTTGAALPDGADTVIMQEHATTDGDRITFSGKSKPAQFARAPGSDTKQGSILLSTGKEISAADIGLLASQGISSINVRKKICVAIVSTGDELGQPGEALRHGQIYDSNRPLLSVMLQQLGFDYFDAGAVGDNPEQLRKSFDVAAENADVIISSGGVSVGEADFVRSILEEFGELKFWKIAMKPGRPLTVGRYKDVPFFGLPGNPVSVAATFTQLVRPALEKMLGLTPKTLHTLSARSANKLTKQAGRMEFQRGVLSKSKQFGWEVSTTGAQDSHVLSSLSKANCYIILPSESEGVEIGDKVEVQPFTGII